MTTNVTPTCHTPEDEWYVANDCNHAHCPNDCGEHPQPRVVEGRMVCGRCLVIDGKMVDMLPCTPETCGE